jgi:apolipoprotein N-acyltransferase
VPNSLNAVRPSVNLALSVLSSVLLVLLFPKYDLTFLAPVALTPILIACAREASWKKRFFHGWAAGIVFWFWTCTWIQFVLEVHGGMGRWGGWGTFTLFAVLKGLHMAVFCMLAGLVMSRAWAAPAIAALWTGLERTHGELGFAWLDLGNAGIDMSFFMRLAPFTGVYGLSFVFATIACVVALLILRRRVWDLAWLAPLVLLVLLPAEPRSVAGAEAARVVQPNIDTEAQWNLETMKALEARLATLSEPPNAPMIVWPEAPAPFYPSSPDFMQYISGIARDSHSYFLLGGVARTEHGDPLNSAFLLDPDGKMVDRYDKIRLVPFGEFVPPIFGWVNRITQEAGDFAPGERVVTFPVADHHIGVFICYESAFPDLVRQFARNGAEALVNISNDGYFGHSPAREQHLALVRMRAAENRRWILRATNDGITAAVDPAGRVVQNLAPYLQTSAILRYGYVKELTAYSRFGDWFAWGCLIAGLGSCAVRRPATKGTDG